MSDVNRHLRGDTEEVLVDVHGNTVIEKGDLTFIFSASNTLKNTMPSARTTADWYAYPVSYLAGSTPLYFDVQFAGVAMKGSKSGVTEKIPIATSGIFRFPLASATGVTIGNLVTGCTSAATVNYNQTVRSQPVSVLTDEYNMALGICVKTQTGAATDVDFKLISRLSGVSYTSLAGK